MTSSVRSFISTKWSVTMNICAVRAYPLFQMLTTWPISSSRSSSKARTMDAKYLYGVQPLVHVVLDGPPAAKLNSSPLSTPWSLCGAVYTKYPKYISRLHRSQYFPKLLLFPNFPKVGRQLKFKKPPTPRHFAFRLTNLR
jgi:hypothetical protein